MINIKKSLNQEQFQVEFIYKDSTAQHVALTGSFNDWDPDILIMSGNDGNVFNCQLELPSGIYEYKFVVDGKWLMDEDNPNFAANDFGTLNSVLILE